MIDNVERVPISRVSEKGKDSAVDFVVTELPLTIMLNSRELVTLLCSPANLEYLAIGFLFSEGLIESKDDISQIRVDAGGNVVRVGTKKDIRFSSPPLSQRLVTSGGGRGTTFYHPQARVESDIKISVGEAFALRDEFVQRSALFKATDSVHSAALCDTKNILVFSEDIGKHNAIDKVFGECLLKDIPTGGRLVITSGLVSSEILLKVAKRDVPLLISKSAPTNMGVRLANDLGVTLVGFAQGKKAKIYTNEWRVVA